MSQQRHNGRIARRVGIGIGIAIGALVVLVVLGPLLVPLPETSGYAVPDALAGPESTFVDIPFPGTDGLTLHVRERGATTGPTASGGGVEAASPVFVLLHGSMFNLTTWAETESWLSSFGRVVAYDQIPYGLSERLAMGDWTGVNPYTQAAAIDQLIALLDARNIDRAILVGHSYGGVLAARAAVEHPDRVDGLVLLAPAVYQTESMPQWILDSPQMQRLGPRMASSLATSEAFFRSCYADPEMWTGERAERSLIHTRVTGWEAALWEYLRAWNVVDLDLASALADIATPTLVVGGEADAIVPIADSQRVARSIPGARFRTLPDVGHMPHEEDPAATAELVRSWLASM